jgi:hypothetical protein
MGSALKFLTRYAQEEEEFLDSFVTGDETWVFSPHTPESKQQSRSSHDVVQREDGRLL